MTMRNVGLASLSGVQAVLSTSDSHVTVTDSQAAFGNLPARGSVQASDTCTIQVAADCPTPHTVDFTLSITDSASGSWTDSFSLPVYTSYQISGTVTRDGAPLANAVIEYRGPLLGTFLTAADGTYMFGVIEGTYLLTAKKDDYLPTEDVEITVPESQSGVDFAFTTATVSGTITNAETGQPLGGASVEYFGGFSGSVPSAGDGSYAITRVYGRDSYLYLTAKADGFFDSNRVRADVPPDVTGADFALGYSDIDVSPSSFSVTAELGQAPTRTLTVANTATQELTWSISHGTLGAVKKTLNLNNIYCGVAWDGTQLWISQGYKGTKLYRLNPDNGSVLGSIDVGFKCYAIDWDGEYLWGLDVAAVKVKKIDPATGSTVLSYDALPDSQGNSPSGIAVSDRFLWVIASFQAHKLNPDTGEIVGTINLSTSTNVQGAAYYNGGIWTRAYTSDYDDGEWITYYGMAKCDPVTGYRLLFVDIPGDWSVGWGTGFSRSAGSGIWVLNGNEKKLRLIETGEVEWLSESPGSGATAGNSSTDVTVTFDTIPAGVGTHNADIIVSSNDPDEPAVTVSVEFTVTDDGENSAPVITASAPDTPFSMDEGTSQEFTVTASDPDGDVLDYIWEFNDNPTDAPSVPSYTYEPDFTGAGTYTISVTVDDRLGGTASHTWDVTVDHVNLAPETEDVYASTPNGSTDPVAISLVGSDFDEDPLVYLIVAGPSHGTLSAVNGNQVTYTPDGAHVGLDTFTYKVSDGALDSNVSTGTIYCGLQLKITDLGTLGGVESAAYAVNRDGDVTGDSRFGTGGNTHLFIYDYSEGTMTDLGDEDHTYTTGLGINRHGDIAGQMYPGGFLYTGGEIVDLGVPGSPDYNAGGVLDINDSGLMAGYSYYVAGWWVTAAMAWIHDGTDYVDLGNFGNSFTYAYAINNLGEVVGAGSAPGVGYVAFIYDSTNGLRDLNTVAPVGEDWVLAYANDIIDDGTVVGTGSFQDEANHGYVYDGDTIVDMGALGSSGSVTAVNNNHVVIGQTYEDRKYRAFMWYPDHGRIPIDRILPVAGEWYLESVRDINDACQMVGYGTNPAGEEHAFLMEPYTLNKLPVAVDDVAETDEDVSVDVNVLANDSDGDGDPLTIIRVGLASNGTAANNGDGTVTYTPDRGFGGVDQFGYTISDGKGGTDTAIVTVTVHSSNKAPDAVDDAVTTPEDTQVSIAVLANDSDPEGDTLSIASVSNPPHGTAVKSGVNIVYTPDVNYHGTDSFNYTISDGNGNTDTATVSVTVTPVNDAPVAVDDSATTAEDTQVSIAVLANDSDVDGDTLSIASVTNPPHGTAVKSGVNIVYTPDVNHNGADSFNYTVSDGKGGTDTATVSVTVTSGNDAPVAVDDNATTPEDTQVSIPVLANDSDPDGDALSIASVTDPPHGTAVKSGSNVLYTPDPNYNGADSFSYTVSDGKGGTDTATVSVTVTPVNDAPVAVDDSATTAEDTQVSIPVLANDTDVDGDTLSIASVTNPPHGTAVKSGVNVVYTPDPNYNGADSFSYTVSDGNGGTDTATVSVTVTPVNDAPVAVDDSATTDENTAVVIDVLANDTDVDGDGLNVASVTDPPHGTAVKSGSNVLYTPDTNYSGGDSFTYTVSDGKGGADTATVSVTVDDVANNPPVAVIAADPTGGRVPLTVSFDGSGSYDPDADAIVDYEWDLGDGNSAYGPQVSHAYTAEGEFTVTLHVFDEHGNVGSADVIITVVLNTPPVARDRDVVTDEDVAAGITLAASDADGDALTYTILTVPQYGDLSGTAPDLKYAPDENWSGVDGLTFKVSDGMDDSSVATVSITVNPVNDAPVADDKTVDGWVNRAVSVELSGSDVEGDALTFAVDSPPSHGTISDLDPEAGTLVYTPDSGFVGSDTFTYVAGDGLADSSPATVTVEMAEIRIVWVSTGKPYSLGTAEADALYYIDRKYTIQDLTSNLDGQVLVRTANNDKYVKADRHLTLSVGREITLSVCYDKRMTTLPAWLSDGTWALTGESMLVRDKAASPMLVYEKTFAAGDITLGGNRASGAAGARSNYVVVARPPGAAGLNGDPLHFIAGPFAPDQWANDGDTDGDGLVDDFEVAVGVDPNDIDTDDDDISDESEIGPDGRSLWDMQLDGIDDGTPGDDVPGDGNGGGGGSGGGCFLRTASLK